MNVIIDYVSDFVLFMEESKLSVFDNTCIPFFCVIFVVVDTVVLW